jgi:hypothetical protein
MLDLTAIARDAEARAKNALARYEQDPTPPNMEALSEAVSNWERAIDVWTAAVYLDADVASDSVG